MNQLLSTSKIRFFLIPLFIALFFIQCDDDDSPPFPYIDFSVSLSISNDLLNMNIGEYVFVNGYNYGLGGFLIYRKDYSEYLAFDRACTHEAKKSCIVEDDTEMPGLMVVCPCCGSKYWVINTEDFGNVYKGPARRGLVQYRTYLSLNSLIVYNN
jgi:Rieske Fe-S protein